MIESNVSMETAKAGPPIDVSVRQSLLGKRKRKVVCFDIV